MSVAYTHVWRASDADRPCNLTGNEGPDPNGNGQIWIEITNQDGTTSVPKEQLVLFDIWRAEQTKAAKIIGNGAGTAPDALQPNPTASVAFLRAIIPAGPWVLTSIVPDGVTRTKAALDNLGKEGAEATAELKSTRRPCQSVPASPCAGVRVEARRTKALARGGPAPPFPLRAVSKTCPNGTE